MRTREKLGARMGWAAAARALPVIVALSCYGLAGTACDTGSGGGDMDAVVPADAADPLDAASEADAESLPDAAVEPDAAPCNPPAPGPSGMNPGANCVSCHNFSVAGTLYDSLNGGSAVASATVRVTDANNTTVEMITATNGNFFTSHALQFPVSIEVSKCDDLVTMPMTANDGSCNGCHGDGDRIHLP